MQRTTMLFKESKKLNAGSSLLELTHMVMGMKLKGDKDICNTSKGVKGQLPFSLIAPGFMIRPGLVNFPFHPLSLAASMSTFSCSPPSYTQQEKATISYTRTHSILHFEEFNTLKFP